MDASCKIQRSIHVFRLVYKYVSRILGTYQLPHGGLFFVSLCNYITIEENQPQSQISTKEPVSLLPTALTYNHYTCAVLFPLCKTLCTFSRIHPVFGQSSLVIENLPKPKYLSPYLFPYLSPYPLLILILCLPPWLHAKRLPYSIR